jgi:uncharacterized membrane protein YraQ (UPF0718 family)
MNLLINIFQSAWHLLQESAVYMIFGLLVSGLFKVFLDPNLVVRHLGQRRFASVFKAALLGIPLPLCSCGVLPAALSLKKQGANNGATAAFMISTPESGIDSIAMTYALLDPIMTVARPVVAFFTAAVAGLAENCFGDQSQDRVITPDLRCPVDGCCDGRDCDPKVHKHHHRFFEKILAGMRYAFTDFWGDLAGWFLFGIFLGGVITALIPDEFFSTYLNTGLPAMLAMLVVGIPLYICATASTPIAAALILKGVSPGAGLVFLLVGPATNIASLTVLVGILGKRATVLYLTAIAVCAILFGLVLDQIYAFWGISARVLVGQTSKVMPAWVEVCAVFFLLAISAKPLGRMVRNKFRKLRGVNPQKTDAHCGCNASCDRS